MTHQLITREYAFRQHTFKVCCLEHPADHGSSWSFVDEASVRERHWNIEPGDFVLDMGAAYGSYTLIALAMGAAGAMAWSPQAPPVDREPGRMDNLISEAATFAASLEANGWRDRVQLFDKIGLYDEPGYFETQTCFFQKEPRARTWEWIPVAPLDQQVRPEDCAGYSRYWAKLDVEGAEVHVLRGGERLLRTLRPRILVENHECHRPGIGLEVRALLEGWGFLHEMTQTYSAAVSHSLYLPPVCS